MRAAGRRARLGGSPWPNNLETVRTQTLHLFRQRRQCVEGTVGSECRRIESPSRTRNLEDFENVGAKLIRSVLHFRACRNATLPTCV